MTVEDFAAESEDRLRRWSKDSDDDLLTVQRVAAEILGSDFDDWYREYQFAQNIRNGQPYFNGPPKLKETGKYSASDLLKCHRKIHYNHLNAPEETENPDGIFYFGTQFEEDLAEQFLNDVVTIPDTYLRNSMWIGPELNTDVGTISLVGSTDPVIVDEDSEPILLTEVKTSSSVEYTSEPKEHHRAQAHAYMYGLSQKFDREINDVVFLYAGRDSLNVKAFHVSFDQEFWENRVVDWLRRNTYYRVFGFLPPAEPEQEWECDFCAYQARCGQTSGPNEDAPAAGFLPLHREYPRSKVREYLEAHDDAKLTPSLAKEYPEVAQEFGAFDWQCTKCESTFAWDSVPSERESAPACPNCEDDGVPGQLRGPVPADQHGIEVVSRPDEGGD